jgi:hypothetical protein
VAAGLRTGYFHERLWHGERVTSADRDQDLVRVGEQEVGLRVRGMSQVPGGEGA